MTAAATIADRPPRFAVFMFILLCVVLATLMPSRAWPLAGVVVGSSAYLLWRCHGLLVAAVGVTLVLAHVHTNLNFGEQALTCGTLLLLCGGVASWSVAKRQGRWSWLAVGGLIAGGVALLLWRQTQPVDDLHVRLMQTNAALLVLVGVGGSALLAKRIGGLQTLGLLGTTVAGPALSLFAVHFSGSLSPELLSLDAWRGQGTEGLSWAKDAFTNSEPWCWATAWVLLPLMMLGLWQACWRGRKQWRRGEAPLAWLFGGGLLLAFVAALPHDVLLLHLEAILLPLFGVADVVLSLVERIQLEPPETP